MQVQMSLTTNLSEEAPSRLQSKGASTGKPQKRWLTAVI